MRPRACPSRGCWPAPPGSRGPRAWWCPWSRPAQAPVGPPWMMTMVGSGRPPARGGDTIQVWIGPPGPSIHASSQPAAGSGPASRSHSWSGAHPGGAAASIRPARSSSAAWRSTPALSAMRPAAVAMAAADDASRRHQRRQPSVQATPIRHVPAPVAHDHDQRLRVEPCGTGLIVGHHQVRPRPVADGPIQLGRQAARRTAVHRRQPGAREGVLGRIGDIGAQERHRRPSGEMAAFQASPGELSQDRVRAAAARPRGTARCAA